MHNLPSVLILSSTVLSGRIQPNYLAIEPNQTPVVSLGSVIEHNRNNKKFLPIERNRLLIGRSNVQLRNGQQENSIKRSITEQNQIRWSLITFDFVQTQRKWFFFSYRMQSNPNRSTGLWFDFIWLNNPGILWESFVMSSKGKSSKSIITYRIFFLQQFNMIVDFQ